MKGTKHERSNYTELHCLRNCTGARSTIPWYDFEGPWAWEGDDLAQGKLTVIGMQGVCHHALPCLSFASSWH
jgi:hypothetical protein